MNDLPLFSYRDTSRNLDLVEFRGPTHSEFKKKKN